jgi:large subunit ribosomal protein L6e
MPNKSRNPVIGRGVRRFGRYTANKKARRNLAKNRPVIESKKQKVTTREGTFKKTPRTVVRPRESRYYDTDNDGSRSLYHKKSRNPPKLRKSLQPGTILILLSGKFRGSRCVLLNNLPSGLLLVTGPYKLNGVPIKRVNPAYVIATSTRIDISGVKLDEKFNDQYFKRTKKEKTGGKKGEPEQRFENQDKPVEEKKVIPKERIEDQANVDQLLEGKIVGDLKGYLQSKFSLSRNQFPHLLKF